MKTKCSKPKKARKTSKKNKASSEGCFSPEEDIIRLNTLLSRGTEASVDRESCPLCQFESPSHQESCPKLAEAKKILNHHIKMVEFLVGSKMPKFDIIWYIQKYLL